MKRAASSISKRVLAFTLCLVLVFGLAPLSALAANPGSTSTSTSTAEPASTHRTKEDIDAAVADMIASGDYVEGEAIVCFAQRPGVFDLPFFPAPAQNSLLSSSERLSTVDEQTYTQATDEEVPDAAKAGGPLSPLLSFLFPSAGEEVSISLVKEDGMTTEQLLRELLADPQVLSAEPNYRMTCADEAPAPQHANNDPKPLVTTGNGSAGFRTEADSEQPSGETTFDMTGYQWFSSGVEASVPQYLINAPHTPNPGVRVPHWNKAGTTNSSGIVAIMDSGVDYTHPDLKNVMYHFAPELQQQLGCGEFGFAPRRDDKTDPMDYYGHGTHCAGIAAAQWNGFGVSGVANGAKLIGISVAMSKEDSSFSYDAVIRGYDFLVNAAASGVDIRAVNRSFAPDPANNADAAMIRAAGEAGIVTCIASGNHSDDLDVIYDDINTKQPSPYVLRVNASRQQNDRAWFSNYGHYITDVFAPGSGLLSTIPLNVEGHWRYFPEADSNPLYNETTFEGALPRVYLGNYAADPETGEPTIDLVELDVSKSNDIGVDGDSASVKFTAGLNIGERPMIVIDVPIGDALDVGAIEDINLALYPYETDVTDPTLQVMLENGEFCDLSQDISASRSDNNLYGWALHGVHLTDALLSGQGLRRITDGGVTYIRLLASAMIRDPSYEIHTKKNVEMHLDRIAFGRKGNSGNLPYRYMNGTSMAAPVVSGCAAVVSSSVEASTPAERAAETVRIMKGAMHQAPGYRGYCKQNGQVDLGILGQVEKYTPVIESAQVTGDLLTLTGAYFGSSAGSLSVGGAKAQPSSWSATSITLPWPAGVSSGLVPISVTSSAGEGSRALPLSAPSSSSASVALYERDLTVPSTPVRSPGITACPSSIEATDEGILFAAAGDGDDRANIATGYLFRSSDAGTTWTSVPLPQDMRNVRLELGDGVLYVMGSTPADGIDYVAQWHLYSFDIAKGTFTHLRSYDAIDGDEITTEGDLAYVKGKLYYVDGEDYGDNTSRARIRPMDDNYVPGVSFYLDHEYPPGGFADNLRIASSGSSIYVCGLPLTVMVDAHVYGLERIDIADDGSISSTDLSAALSGWKDDAGSSDVALAAGENGVYFITSKAAGLLPEGAHYTDTLFLEKNAESFAPYSRTLSLGPLYYPVATYAHGQLYAFAASAYEQMPVFGRVTEVADAHEWGEPAYEWSADNSQVTATHTCRICGKAESETVNTTSKVTKEPEVGVPGVRTYTAEFAASWAQTQTKNVEIPPIDPTITYAFTAGDGSSWTKGAKTALAFTVERSVEDSAAFEHFAGIEVDGKAVDASGYKAQSGSVKLQLQSAFLETLAVGKHELTARFDDGSAKASFTVRKASGKEEKKVDPSTTPDNPQVQAGKTAGSPARTAAATPAGKSAATADGTPLGLAVAGALCGVAAIALAIVRRRRGRTAQE